jgi:hypothetical protein
VGTWHEERRAELCRIRPCEARPHPAAEPEVPRVHGCATTRVGMKERCRCTECRKWFAPDRRVGDRQRTCSRACRLKRRRKQAARRRGGDIESHREDERARQQRWRAERRRLALAAVAAAGESVAARAECHAPSTDGKSRESIGKLLEIVDEQLQLSRTEFERRQVRIRGEIRRFAIAIEVQVGP